MGTDQLNAAIQNSALTSEKQKTERFTMEAFKALGISSKTMRVIKDTSQLFVEAADGISKVKIPSKARIAMICLEEQGSNF